MAAFMFPVLASVWVIFLYFGEEAEQEEKLWEEDRALRSISAKEELQQGFQAKGIIKKNLDWFIDFGPRRMKTHHILTSSLLIPNVCFSIGGFSSHWRMWHALARSGFQWPWRETRSGKIARLWINFRSLKLGIWAPSLPGRCSSNAIAFYMHLANLPAFFRSTHVFVLTAHKRCLRITTCLHIIPA